MGAVVDELHENAIEQHIEVRDFFTSKCVSDTSAHPTLGQVAEQVGSACGSLVAVLAHL